MMSFKNCQFLLLPLFLVCFISGLNAQTEFIEGYIVTLQKDTLHGLLKEELNETSFDILFKESKTGKEKKYTPDMIPEFYRSSGELYQSNRVKVGEETLNVFLKCVIIGKVGLYIYMDNRMYEHFYMHTASEGFRELITEKTTKIVSKRKYDVEYKLYEGELINAMKDCPKIESEIKKMPFNEFYIKKIIRNYHACIGAEYIEVRPAKKKWKVEFGGYVGYLLGSVDVGDKSELLTGNDFVGFVNIYLPKSRGRYSVQVNYIYSRFQLETIDGVLGSKRLNFMINRYYNLGERERSRFSLKSGMEMIFAATPLSGRRDLDFVAGLGYDYKIGKIRLLSSVEYRILNFNLLSFNLGLAF